MTFVTIAPGDCSLSYDLEIACSVRPASDFLAGLRAELPDGIDLGDPYAVELEDLPEPLLSYVLSPKWLMQILVPYSLPKGYQAKAKIVAGRIAEQTKGAVFDPQEDRVIWPRGKPVRYVRPAGEEKIRVVNLEWFLAPSAARSAPEILLRALRLSCPEALPVRFGTYEPLKEKVSLGGDARFIEMWSDEERTEYGGSFYWSATAPCLGGGASFPDKRETLTREAGEVVQLRPAGAQRAIRLHTYWDGRAADADPRWSETIVTVFREVSRRLRAFYAAGYVQRNLTYARRKIWYGPEAETHTPQFGRWWVGLPRMSMWLSWFGGPYRDLVGPHLESAQRFAEGYLLRIGTEPMDIDQLAGSMPPLPQSLVVGEEVVRYRDVPELRLPGLSKPLPSHRIPEYSVPPAEWIPELS